MNNNKYDWIIHYVFGEGDDYGLFADIHTHGLEKYNHPELLITIALPQEIVGAILNNLGIRITNGERFDESELRTDIIANNVPVKVFNTCVNEKNISLLIFPDKNLKFPDDEACEFPYNEQYKYLEKIKERYENCAN